MSKTDHNPSYFAKKGRRKHISVRKDYFERLRQQSARTGTSMGQIADRDINSALDAFEQGAN